VKGIQERFKSERARYQQHYGITDYFDPKHFNLIIQTDTHPLDEVVEKVVAEYKNWLAN
jgi:cytidylate kinase